MPDYNQTDRYLSNAVGTGERPLLALLLRLLHQHYTREIDEALRAEGFDGVTQAHANVFAFARPEGVTVAELAVLAHVRKQTMTQAVEQMEALGYVERRPDPADARARLVLLTERGAAVRPVAVAAGRRVEERWARLTGEADLEQLRAGMQRLLALLADADTVS